MLPEVLTSRHVWSVCHQLMKNTSSVLFKCSKLVLIRVRAEQREDHGLKGDVYFYYVCDVSSTFLFTFRKTVCESIESDQSDKCCSDYKEGKQTGALTFNEVMSKANWLLNPNKVTPVTFPLLSMS